MYSLNQSMLTEFNREFREKRSEIYKKLSSNEQPNNNADRKLFSLINKSNLNENEASLGFPKLRKDVENFLVDFVLEYFSK